MFYVVYMANDCKNKGYGTTVMGKARRYVCINAFSLFIRINEIMLIIINVPSCKI